MILRAISRASLIGSLVLALHLRSAVISQGLLLTEFMADNSKTLADEDGDFEDWLEVFNSTDAEVNLEGYSLTDDKAKPSKWKFPAVTLGPRRFLIVRCSGKDLRDPALELHASFKLSSGGEGLFLFAPDGVTLVSGYEHYPDQQPDVSYGMSFDSTSATPVVAGAAARVLVPTGPDLALRWTETDFDDSSWRQGTTAVGFGVRSPELELLGTDMGTEMLNVNASVYVRIPFEVADPSAVDVMKLRVRYDDGFAAFLNGEPLAAANAPAVLDWSSKAVRSHTPGTYEELDATSALKLLKPGRNVLAIQGLNSAASNSDLFLLPEIELIDIRQVQTAVHIYFPAPTQGAPNGPGFADAPAKPVFSLGSGVYAESLKVEIRTELPGASIRYTVNGAVPDESSTLYAGPIDVTGPVQVTARVFKDGQAPGIPERNTYVILDPTALEFSTNLPVVLCTTFGRAIGGNCGGGPYTPGHIFIITPSEGGRTALTDEPHLSSGAAFRRRGSSTCGYDKFAFNVEVLDAEGRDKTVEVFGFPKDSDYVMFGGNNFDRALLRNPIAYWMSLEVGQWAARSRFVECFYHPGKGPVTRSSYFGIYAFMEKNKRAPERINVARIGARDKKEPAVTGGYALRRDRQGPDEIAISGGGYSSLVFVYPKNPVREQQQYMTGFLNEVVASLNPNVGSQKDNQLIDFTAWIDHHILCWYPKNVDAFRLSGYFYKDRGGPLVMGPVWDYDRTMGCSDDDRARDPTGWNNDQVGDGGTRYFEAGGLGSWYSFLFANQPPNRDTPWNRAYQARWRELRKGPLRTERILGQIDAWAEELKEAGDRNTARWQSQRPRFGSLQGEIDHLKDWLAIRADWIDSQFIESPRFNPAGGQVPKGQKVELSINADAAIFYTLDRSDPRGPGGTPAPAAVAYSGPITIESSTEVAARARYPDGLWSGLVRQTYIVDIPRLTITEIMFNPTPPTPEEDPQGQFNALKMEFVELTNVGEDPIPLAGFTFSKGVTFTFDGSAVPSLAPGRSVVVPRDKDAFAARYGAQGILVAGAYTGSLADQGEPIALKGAFGEVIFDFRFSGTWYPETNGGGRSLVNVDPLGPAGTLGDAARWRPSDELNGSPGRAEGLGPAGRVLPGDANGDGKIQVTDAIRTLLLLVAGLRQGPCGQDGLDGPASRKVLDWDGNGTVNTTDAVLTLQYLFLAGPPHAAGTGCFAVEGCEGVCAR